MEDEDALTNALYMGEMFPSLRDDVVADILARNRNNLERSMDEALSVVAIEEEQKHMSRSTAPSVEARLVDTASAAPRSPEPADGCDAGDLSSVATKPKSQGRGFPVEIPPGFLAVPMTRLVLGEVRRQYTDYVFHVHKRHNTKIGITLCRADGCIALYSVNPALMRVADSSSSLVTIKPGDVLFGINHEFFSAETSIDDVSFVLSNAGRYVSLHLRRISPCSAHLSANNIQEHSMVKLILQAYKSSPPGFTDGFSESLGSLLRNLSTWGEGYVFQNIPNKLLHRNETGTSRDSYLISRVFKGHVGDDDVAMPPARRNEVMRGAVSAMSMAPYVGSPANDKGVGYASTNARRGDLALAALTLPGVQLAITKQHWSQRVKVDVRCLRPALTVRLGRVIKHRNNGFTEYVLCVSDVLSGHEWTLSKGYTDFSELKKEIFDKSPELFKYLPLMSKSDNSIVQKFLKCLMSILETSLLSHEMLSVYLTVMSFFAVPERLVYINSLIERQSLAVELQRGVEALAHSVLQTPQLRQLIALATTSCSSLLQDEVSRFRKERHLRGVLTSEAKKEDSSGCLPVYRYSTTDSGSVPALQTVSRWLDSMQELLVNGLLEDSKMLAKSIIARRLRTQGSKYKTTTPAVNLTDPINVCVCDELDHHTWSDVPSDDEVSHSDCLRHGDESTILFEQLGGLVGDACNPKGSVCSVLNDSSSLQQWLEENRHRDTNFIVPDELYIPLVRESIRRQVEIELFVPLEAHIRIIISEVCLEDDCAISEKLQKVRNCSQSDFGIPGAVQSPSNWKLVAGMLRDMFSRSNPMDRIQALKAAVKEIPLLYDKERQERDSLCATSDLPFGLSAFSFEVNNLCDTKLKISETGYILATFEASVHHLIVGEVVPK